MYITRRARDLRSVRQLLPGDRRQVGHERSNFHKETHSIVKLFHRGTRYGVNSSWSLPVGCRIDLNLATRFTGRKGTIKSTKCCEAGLAC